MKNKYDLPILRGDDNEYGEYDYFANELPAPECKWLLSVYTRRCDNCRKESHLSHYQSNSFYTLDGYDSLDYNECWRCIIKGRIYSLLSKIKKAIKRRNAAIKLSRCMPRGKRFAMYHKLVSKSCKILD